MSNNQSEETKEKDDSILSNGNLDECKLMRKWINRNNQYIEQYHNILYISVMTILAVSFTSKTIISCLIPYSIIVPLFYMEQKKHEGICMLASYIMVFGKELHWEMRHVLFEENIPYKVNRVGIVPLRSLKYFAVSILCSGAAIIKLFITEEYKEHPVFTIIYFVLILGGTVLVFLFFKLNTFNYQIHRKEMFASWALIYLNERSYIQTWNKEISNIIKEGRKDTKGENKEDSTRKFIVMVIILIIGLLFCEVNYNRYLMLSEEPPMKVQIIDDKDMSNEGATVGATISLP